MFGVLVVEAAPPAYTANRAPATRPGPISA